MATFVITISTEIILLGGGPPTTWGDSGIYTMVWGSSFWGEGSIGITKDVDKLVEETITVVDAVTKKTDKLLQNTIAVSNTIFDINMKDSRGYYYVFPGNTVDGEDIVSATYTTYAGPSATWSTYAVSTTSWS